MISIGQAEYLGASVAQDNDFELDDILDYVASTAVDIGVTTWNSLVPEWTGLEADTASILHGINEDMGQFYDNNTELVNASSFVGGLFVPMLAASKAMKAVTTASGWVGKATPFRYLAGKEASYTAAAKTALVNGGKTSAEFRNAANMLKFTQAGTGLAEGAFYEAGFLLLMNDHAYMENNYTVSDYAIGMLLGALAGPVRMWQGSKAFKAMATKIQLDQQAKMSNPITIATDTASEQLQVRSTMANYAAEVDLNELSSANQLVQQTLHEQATISVFDQVATMSTPAMKKQSDNLPKNFDRLLERPMYEDPTISWVAKMELAKPGTFAGAAKFIPYDATKVVSNVMDLVVQETKEGLVFESGSVARTIIAPNNVTNPALARTTAPGRLSVSTLNDMLDIKLEGKALNTDERAWLASYLVSPAVKDKQVRLGANIRLSKKAMQEAAVFKEVELLGSGFIPYEQALDTLEETRRVAVISPFHGNRILGELEAKVSAGIGDYPSIKVDKSGRGTTAYTPFEMSSPMADKAYIEAIYRARSMTPVDGVFTLPESGVAALPIVQALHAANIGKQFSIRMQDKALIGPESVAAWLWEQKVAEVRHGLGANASTAQIARQLNMPVDTIDTIIAWGKSPMPRTPELPISIYTDPKMVDKYTRPSVAIHGNDLAMGRHSEIEITKRLDFDTIKGMHDTTVATVINASAGPIELNEMLSEVYQSAMMGAVRDGLPHILADIGSKSKLITSTDMALRSLGPLADHIGTIGRTGQHLVNKHITRVAKTIEPTLQAVETDIASAAQFAQFEQAIQALDSATAKAITYDPAARKIIDTRSAATLKVLGTDTELVLTDKMDKFVQAYLPVMQEQHEFLNANRRLAGLNTSKPNGVWLPYETLDHKLVAYKIPKAGVEGESTLIVAHTADKLGELVTAAQGKFGDTHRIITRDTDSIAFNALHYQAELNPLKRADAELRKAGIAINDIVPGTEAIRRFRQSLKDDIWTKHRRMMQLANSDVYSVLDDYAKQETKYAKSGIGNLLQKIQKPLSAAEIAKRTMLNSGVSDYYPIIDMGNNIVSASINTVLHKADQITNGLTSEFTRKGTTDWVKYRDALESAGVPVLYKDEHAYAMARRGGEALNTAEQRIAQVQSLDVLFRLRFAELAHAGITVLSTPVVLAGELSHNKMPMKTMIQGIKFMYGKGEEGTRVLAKAKDLGYVTGVIAEAKEAIQNLHVKDITKDNPRLFGWLTKASDASEDFVREWAFSTGYIMAKDKFPGAAEALLMSHAQAFTQRTMGNYVAKQRPVLFQGAMGSMLGLYQTFMVTMGQNMFRYLEAGDTRAISTLFGAQATMFGLESLPFFQDFNQVMGEYMSDEHMDVRSTGYAAVGKDAAEFILYGLPSAAFGNSLYTRAAWQPRTPFDETGATNGLSVKPVIWATISESLDFGGTMISGIANSLANGGGLMDAQRSVLQAAAAQTIWRPLARSAELVQGVSYDKKGELLSTNDEVWAFPAIAARVLGTRPLKESVLRNARYATSYYNGVDRDMKARAIKQLRRSVVEDNNPDAITNIMSDYLDAGGSYKGWKDIYNKSAVSVGTPFAQKLLEFSEKQPAMQALIDEYAN
jgi:hypothetical protein